MRFRKTPHQFVLRCIRILMVHADEQWPKGMIGGRLPETHLRVYADMMPGY
jgi:hypothetical protein